MIDEAHLRDKLRKIEALFAGAATPGERQAAGAAAERIRLQLVAAASTESEIEMRFSIPNPWSRRLFIALCRRYGLRPFRYGADEAADCHRQATAYLPRALAVAPIPGD
jgi:hypothetical protein